MKKIQAALLLIVVSGLASCAYIAEFLEPVNGTWSGTMTMVDVEAPITFDVSLERTDETGLGGSMLSMFVGTEPLEGTLPAAMTGSIIDGDIVMTVDVLDAYGVRQHMTFTGTIGGGQSSGDARIDSYEGTTLIEQIVGTYVMAN